MSTFFDTISSALHTLADQQYKELVAFCTNAEAVGRTRTQNEFLDDLQTQIDYIRHIQNILDQLATPAYAQRVANAFEQNRVKPIFSPHREGSYKSPPDDYLED